MLRYSITPTNFIITHSTIAKNTLQFENMCIKDKPYYTNETSRFGLFTWDNPLLNTYLPSIIDNAKMLAFPNPTTASKYYQNPQKVSIDISGLSDYWYIILAMNGYTSRYEFKDFTSVLIPDINYMNKLVTSIEKEYAGVI